MKYSEYELTVYRIYLSLKNHFINPKYDCIRYKFNLKKGIVSSSNLSKSGLSSSIKIIAKDYDTINKVINLFLANFKLGVFDTYQIMNGIGKENFNNHQKELKNINYNFSYWYINNKNISPSAVLKDYIKNIIPIEIACIYFMNSNHYNDLIKIDYNDLLYGNSRLRIEKYIPFIKKIINIETIKNNIEKIRKI